MPFIEEILKHKSLSIVGMEKNTGKTECLNYILGRISGMEKKIAVTSIGVDGEKSDIVKKIKKPEIELCEDVVFITSENHYNQKNITAEILDVSTRKTPLGRLVTARSRNRGKIIFSGPSDTQWLRSCIAKMDSYCVDTTIVDGALSRISHASPAITDCMILTTGAAVSTNLPQLIKKTKFIYELLKIPVAESHIVEKISGLDKGIYNVVESGDAKKLNISSAIFIEKHKEELFRYGSKLYFTGMLTDRVLKFLNSQNNINEISVIVRDFTCLFVTPGVLNDYKNKGGKIYILYNTKLIAVCVNPVSPDGFIIDSSRLRSELSKALDLPVYDVKNIEV